MTPDNSDTNQSTAELAGQLLEQIGASWSAQLAHVAAALRIPDHVQAGPLSVEQLAELTCTQSEPLSRLLRALVSVELCLETPDGFLMTRRGALLASNVPGSLRSWAIWWGSSLWRAWGGLLSCVKDGGPQQGCFAELELDPLAARVFHEAMTELTSLILPGLLAGYDFGSFAHIVDVGGGSGLLLSAVLGRYPHIRGILFDQPHAVAGAQANLEQARLQQRCDLIAGDFFECVPSGADAYILKSIIHDWNDADALRILRRCREAMLGHARLLLIERVLPERASASHDYRSAMRTDLTMLVALGARERTERDFQQLLGQAGLRTMRSIAIGGTFSVIEAVRR